MIRGLNVQLGSQVFVHRALDLIASISEPKGMEERGEGGKEQGKSKKTFFTDESLRHWTVSTVKIKIVCQSVIWSKQQGLVYLRHEVKTIVE